MKLDQKAFEVNSTMNPDAEEQEMTIHEDSLQHIMDILTRLYPNPIKAVIREYLTNAFDSHIEAKQSRPVELKLPTEISPNLSIKDFGVGMDKDRVLYQYSAYGYSTKRDSNDQTGALGLGCKSALCVTSQFTLRAVKDKQLTVAMVGRNDKGSGTFKIVHEAYTEEANGVTINIPVPSSDVKNYRKEAIEFLAPLDPSIYTIINDDLDPSSFLEKAEITTQNENLKEAIEDINSLFSLYTYKRSGIFGLSTTENRYSRTKFGEPLSGQGSFNCRTSFYVEMGNILYPINSKLTNNTLLQRLIPMYGNICVIEAQIGDLSIAPQREELMYDKKTEDWLTSRIKEIEETYISKIQKAIDKASSGREALETLSSFYNTRDYQELLKLGPYFTYEDKVIPASIGPSVSKNNETESTAAYWKQSEIKTRHVFTDDDATGYNVSSKYQAFKDPNIDKKKRNEISARIRNYYDAEFPLLDKSGEAKLFIIKNCNFSATISRSMNQTERKKLLHLAKTKEPDLDPNKHYYLLSDGSAAFESIWSDHIYTSSEVEEAWKNRPKEAKEQAEAKTVSNEDFEVYFSKERKDLEGHRFTDYSSIARKNTTIAQLATSNKQLNILAYISSKKRSLDRVRVRLSMENLARYLNMYHPGNEEINVVEVPRSRWNKLIKENRDKFITIDDYADKFLEEIVNTIGARKIAGNKQRMIHTPARDYKTYSVLTSLGITQQDLKTKELKDLYSQVEAITGIKSTQATSSIPSPILSTDMSAIDFFDDLKKHGIVKTSINITDPSLPRNHHNTDKETLKKMEELKNIDQKIGSKHAMLGALIALYSSAWDPGNSVKNWVTKEDLKEAVLDTINRDGDTHEQHPVQPARKSRVLYAQRAS